ncbi:DUF732 domain-containing protein [Actinokineospora sp. PR83]|uniref:DUF732 domain-containing protein n=1 Tax=Actinokineospora sp. PR83 TaxID=2884908 RepID=UPI001F3E7820|nr:DUF732 domain-containing protein [Actinokineospora sp. PR83]MCG8918335.1 DUF732 domain-containing protein [Actinokineospora sp. PR83]
MGGSESRGRAGRAGALVAAAVFALVGCTVPPEFAAESAAPTTAAPTTVESTSAVPSAEAPVSAAPTTSAMTTTTKPGASAGVPSAPAVSTAPPRAAPPAETVVPTGNRVPGPPKREAYLAALTKAGVPVSATGDAEVLIAQAVCNERPKGTSHATLVERVAGFGGGITPAQAEAIVTAAEDSYC